MSTTIPTETIDESQIPLLIDLENKEDKSDVEVEVSAPMPVGVTKRVGFLKRRITWYWIAAIAQFCQTTLQVFGFASLATFKGDLVNGPLTRGDRFIFGQSAFFSWFTLVLLFSLIHQHYASQKANYTPKPGAKKVTAGKHYRCAMVASWMNLITWYMQYESVLGLMVLGLETRHTVYDILHVVSPLLIGFQFVGIGASAMAAILTKRGAKMARGTDMVVDPDNKVEAWTLATTLETIGTTTAVQLTV